MARDVCRHCARTRPSAVAQALSHRGFVEGTAIVFPQDTRNDATQLVGDLLAREEISVRPARWFLFAGGVDFRANSHDQVDDRWQLDFFDRGRQRPACRRDGWWGR